MLLLVKTGSGHCLAMTRMGIKCLLGQPGARVGARVAVALWPVDCLGRGPEGDNHGRLVLALVLVRMAAGDSSALGSARPDLADDFGDLKRTQLASVPGRRWPVAVLIIFLLLFLTR